MPRDAASIAKLENAVRDACAVLVGLVALIPPDLQDARRQVCAVIIEQMMLEIDHLLGGTLRAPPTSELHH